YKREVGWFGSFAMAYGDVGADIYIGLGIVFLYAAGAAPIAILIASLAYISIALAYAELAPTYPYAGGVHVYALRAWDTLISFIVGWAIMLDYTICASLFATAASGYLHFIFPELGNFSIRIGGFELGGLGLIGSALLALLVALNYIGIKYSAGFNNIIVTADLIITATILSIGFLTSFDYNRFIQQITQLGNNMRLEEVEYLGIWGIPMTNFLYGITIAMTSFIGVESIAQAAEETKLPHKWIPRATKLAALVVPLVAFLICVLTAGVINVNEISVENPWASVISKYKIFGKEMALMIAVIAVLMTLVSSNTGIIGVSRLTASMGKLNLLPKWLYMIHPRFRTPTRTLLVFGVIALLLTLPGNIPFLASLYNYGAMISYIVLLLALISLKIKEPRVYRPWSLRPSLKLAYRGKVVEIPVIAIAGLVINLVIFGLYILLHPIGRLLGSIWLLAGIGIYVLYRKFVAKAPVISYAEKNMVIPIGYRMRLTVFVRPTERPEQIVETISTYADKRFDLKLVSVIEPSIEEAPSPSDYEQVKWNLEEMVKDLRSKGYNATCEVKVGDLEKIAEAELRSGEADFLVYIVRGFEKATFLKQSAEDAKIHSIIERHPGCVVLLKRVIE
ncbi:MAG: APC family permease, partial [Nitrososphaerota archaeon]|nr:APC family permease [Nitrososphaerota archaeon]